MGSNRTQLCSDVQFLYQTFATSEDMQYVLSGTLAIHSSLFWSYLGTTDVLVNFVMAGNLTSYVGFVFETVRMFG